MRYSAYGEPTVYPVADLNMNGGVNSTDSALWGDLLYTTSNASVYADSDLDWDGADDWNSGGADGDVFYESYNENLGLSGVGRVSSPGVDSRTGYEGYQWDQTISAYHVRYRVYLPDLGRWTRRDPLGYVDGTHRYKYSDGRPTFGVDAMGLVTLPSDPAKHPRICCGQTRDEWPFTHCEMKWGACADGEREHEVWTDRSASRSLADGTPCSSATREQITSCLGVNPHDNHPDKTKPYGLGNNCQASVVSKVGQWWLVTRTARR